MSYLIHPAEWKILRRAMELGIERGITRPCGTLFVRPWDKHGNTSLSIRFETARLCVLEQLAPEYEQARGEFLLISLRTAKAAATRTANLAKKLTAELGPKAAQHALTEMQLDRAHIEARYGTAPNSTIITDLATKSQRSRFDAIQVFAENNLMTREKYAWRAAEFFEGMRSHSSYRHDEEPQ
jgi:hypothetical protein